MNLLLKNLLVHIDIRQYFCDVIHGINDQQQKIESKTKFSASGIQTERKKDVLNIYFRVFIDCIRITA